MGVSAAIVSIDFFNFLAIFEWTTEAKTTGDNRLTERASQEMSWRSMGGGGVL